MEKSSSSLGGCHARAVGLRPVRLRRRKRAESSLFFRVSGFVTSGGPGSEPGVAVVHRPADVKYSVPEGVSVFMYHMIGDEQGNAAIMTEANLRIQMNYLRDHGYHPITMQELYDYVTKGAPLPEKPVCITFDDGYLDSYTIVYPMMKEYGFPWTLFLITDDVGKPYNRMTWDQLREMANSHTVTIASHTLSHPKLHNLATARRRRRRSSMRIRHSSTSSESTMFGWLIRMATMTMRSSISARKPASRWRSRRTQAAFTSAASPMI